MNPAPNWTSAYENAKYEFIFVFKGINPANEGLMCFTMIVPKEAVTTQKTFFVNGAALNADNCYYAQISLTTTAMGDVVLRRNNVTLNNVIVSTYYR